MLNIIQKENKFKLDPLCLIIFKVKFWFYRTTLTYSAPEQLQNEHNSSSQEAQPVDSQLHLSGFEKLLPKTDTFKTKKTKITFKTENL